ncbi:transcription factor with AP2 domain(s), putative [Plasmodium knowlesi strain H]|uniref:Transcription factor with AP2 domain(S), putative n=3 Tax=Plasmodium knowlesi TaxID=5850 RepID=A0A5K1VNQ1_PLAKH|nr:AP2 domain transcription factor AP2-EXP, putative [Plasmodium knowlesi strain H]OTN65446.1 putative AP2 family [Plasmodium knowlesi]CAA9989477.1 AP2 domain transcription factor AP2-EXP, putative [Plasmodium knowlesi strain H]SBO25137.1 transcription factor with AP2 domain(s), putative [Plasmodium knowlesi strain H]SBO27795.1 transcription factor with AP2 domain(s), putative [Plasmodium knowlesi strain H]VVS78951.1 AP2 domain transcription factor AP2-EXP, putative [Plasmodium knowlesi strain|eukprot:XP_002260202.1 AP2 family, putative [Plasmodium knowlesi strain H]
MDEVVNADQTFNPAVMPMDGKVATNDSSNKVNNNLNSVTPPTMLGSMGSTMVSGFIGNMNGSIGNPMDSLVVGPMNHNIMNAMSSGRTNTLNNMSNVVGRGNRNKSGSNNNGTKMGPMKSSPSNDPNILANNLVNTVVNTVVDTMSNSNHSVGNLGISAMSNVSNNTTKGSTQPVTGQVIKKKVGRPKGTTSANKVIKKEEKVSTSSSGYPGVSWNKRMCAWLAFFYDGASRRSRTFHPKHFNMDKEKARLSAVEFMKSLENNGRKKSTKNKTGRSKAKQLNEEMIRGMMSNDMASTLNNRAPNGTPIPIHLMPLNRGFYMQNMNRNFNLPGMPPSERSSMNNTYNSLGNTSNLGGMAQRMQDAGGIYIHNGGAPAHTMFGGNMHMLGSVKSNANVNGTGCTSSNNNGCSSGGNNGVGNGSGNNMLYLNELMFHSNLIQGGVAGGAGNGNGGNPSAGGNVNFVDRNMSSNNAASDLLKMEENLGLHNKDMQTLMNTLFRQNYNMNMSMANIDKHQYLHTSGKNNGTGQSGMKTSSNTTNGINNNNNGVNPIGGTNLPNSNSAANSMNSNSSQGPHLYLSNHGPGDVFENGNDSNNGVSMPNITMNNMVNLNNIGNLPNYYDYNFDPYGGNISPHLIDMVHRLNNDMKDDGKSGGVAAADGTDGRSDDVNELIFSTTDNATWINQLKHSQNNLCNNLNNNPCDLCDTSSASPEPNMAKKMDLGNRKKTINSMVSMSNRKSEMVDAGATSSAHHVNGDGNGGDNAGGNVGGSSSGNNGSANFDVNSNLPCECAPHLRNQKKHFCMYYPASNSNGTNDDNYSFMPPWNGNNNPNSSNNRMNNLDSNNEKSIDSSSHLGGTGSSNTNSINMGTPNSVVLCISTNNNQINSLAQNATHLAGNIEMNPKQGSHSSSAFSGTPNLQDIQKQLHFQAQSGIGTSAPDLHNALQMTKQTNNFAQKVLTNNNSNGGTNNNVSGASNIGGSNSISPTANGTSAHKKRGPKDNRKNLLPATATVAPSTEVSVVGPTGGVTAAAAPSHAMNTQSAQNGKNNGLNLNFVDHNNICNKLNSFINFEWLSSDTKTHPNRNNQGTFENEDT